MSQSRKLSLIESLTNVAVGFGVSLASQIVIFSGYGVKLPLIDNIAITVWFTLISIARSYLLRRAFNRVREPATDQFWGTAPRWHEPSKAAGPDWRVEMRERFDRESV